MVSDTDVADELDEITPTPKIAARLRAFVELCGKHPFATGLFAIVGVLGLFLSFVQFGVDQAQSSEDSKVASDVQDRVRKIEKNVQDISKVAKDTENSTEPPIALVEDFSTKYADNVSFPDGEERTVIADILQKNRKSFYNLPFMYFTVQSKLNQDYAQIAPYIIAEIQKVEKIDYSISTIYDGGRGDAAVLNYLNVALIPKAGIQIAALVDATTGQVKPDVQYFKLAPREPEEFMLSIQYVPGYVYTVRFGIPFRRAGSNGTKWITPSLRLGIPDSKHPVKMLDSDFVVQLHPDIESEEAADAVATSKANDAYSRKQVVFKPKDIVLK